MKLKLMWDFYLISIIRVRTNPEGPKEFIPLLIPCVMLMAGGGLFFTIIAWQLMLFSSSFLFGLIGLNAGHHHPELFHDGDNPREDKDWGLYQLDAVRERKEIKGVLLLGLVTFGDHALHHLFPSLDHSYLSPLYPVLEEVCQDFGYELKISTVMDMVKGQFQQLARIDPISF